VSLSSIFLRDLSLCRSNSYLFDDLNAGALFLLTRLGPNRMDLRDRRQRSVKRKIEIDFTPGVAAVESELPFFRTQDVPIRTPVRISGGFFRNDAGHDQVLERAWILTGRVVEHSHGALQRGEPRERDGFQEVCGETTLRRRPEQRVQRVAWNEQDAERDDRRDQEPRAQRASRERGAPDANGGRSRRHRFGRLDFAEQTSVAQLGEPFVDLEVRQERALDIVFARARPVDPLQYLRLGA